MQWQLPHLTNDCTVCDRPNNKDYRSLSKERNRSLPRLLEVTCPVHVLGDFNFKDIDWPDRLSKLGSTLSQSEGQILIDIMNDHGLEQMVHLPTREKNTLDLILTTLLGQFKDVYSPDKLSDHDIVSGTLKIFIPPIKKPRRKVSLYQKGDHESMRKDTLEFVKEKYFSGHSDTRSVQETFDLLTSIIQDTADKHIPSKTSRSVSVP